VPVVAVLIALWYFDWVNGLKGELEAGCLLRCPLVLNLAVDSVVCLLPLVRHLVTQMQVVTPDKELEVGVLAGYIDSLGRCRYCGLLFVTHLDDVVLRGAD
jgi:hypothetical protein